MADEAECRWPSYEANMLYGSQKWWNFAFVVYLSVIPSLGRQKLADTQLFVDRGEVTGERDVDLCRKNKGTSSVTGG
jgi:hypothetical protein